MFGVDMEEARARYEESFQVIVGAWTTEHFDHDGRFWKLRDVTIYPRPIQKPHPPIWEHKMSLAADCLLWRLQNRIR